MGKQDRQGKGRRRVGEGKARQDDKIGRIGTMRRRAIKGQDWGRAKKIGRIKTINRIRKERKD